MNYRMLVVTALILVCWSGIRSQETAGLERFAGIWRTSSKDTGTERILVISVSGNAVELAETYVSGGRTYTDKGIYYIDKRGEKNLLEIPNVDALSEVRSKTEYKKGKLVMDLNYSVEFRGGTRGGTQTSDHKVRKEFVLSADTQTLTLNKRTTFSTRLSQEEIRRAGPVAGANISAPVTGVFETVYKRRN